jgi:hypothetical protein
MQAKVLTLDEARRTNIARPPLLLPHVDPQQMR